MSGIQAVVFAGTSDGKNIAQSLALAGIETLMCVATGYGADLAEPTTDSVALHQGRMDADAMLDLLKKHHPRVVIDATHPYASAASANICRAAQAAGIQLLRLLRREWEGDESVVTVADPVQAARFLSQAQGQVFLTTGSKDLEAFTAVPDYENRIAVRVLPSVEALEKCAALGWWGDKIIAMQGPFTHGMNVEIIRQKNISWLVTKDSGAVGGFYEKLSAVRETGIGMILIRRPQEAVKGMPYDQVMDILSDVFGIGFTADSQAIEGKALKQEQYPRFPMFVDLSGKRVVLVGGGKVCERRAVRLLDCGADVTVIAPAVTDELTRMAKSRVIRWLQRGYQEGDLQGAALVVAATNHREINERVEGEACASGIPCSRADDKAKGTFWFPAMVRHKNLVYGIVSRDGDHSAVRKATNKLREYLGE